MIKGVKLPWKIVRSKATSRERHPELVSEPAPYFLRRSNMKKLKKVRCGFNTMKY